MKSGRGLESLPKKTVWVIFSKFWAVSGLILSKCSILLSTYIWTYCRSGLQIEKLRLEPSFTPRNDRNRISNDRSGFPYNQESFIFHWFAADSADIRSLHLARVPLFRIEPIESSSRGNLRWPHSRGLCLFHFVFLCLLPRYLFVGLHRTLTTPLRMPDTNEALGWDSLLKIGRSLVVTVTGWGGVSTNGIPVRVCWLKSQRKFGGFFLFWAEIWLCNEIRFEFPEFYLVQQIP